MKGATGEVLRLSGGHPSPCSILANLARGSKSASSSEVEVADRLKGLFSFQTRRREKVPKRVKPREPYIWERNNATHWLTRDAERESAWRFFVRGLNRPIIAESTMIDAVR